MERYENREGVGRVWTHEKRPTAFANFLFALRLASLTNFRFVHRLGSMTLACSLESAHSQTFGLLSASGLRPSLESRPSGSQNRICFSSLELGGSLASFLRKLARLRSSAFSVQATHKKPCAKKPRDYAKIDQFPFANRCFDSILTFREPFLMDF
ncbi:hypothetical protein SDC9_20312 [bioreactor metagenome]|uniref:Uncharacterized protein n=1 Tax=bioreactor metagenome TaxID=1076179 RepID=A0A644U6D5_9ZZZZ